MKAIISVAGLWTRMLPATKATSKELLPVVDKPFIQYVVSEVAAGFREIILITHSSNNSIENHFYTGFELEVPLDKRVKRRLLAEAFSGDLLRTLGFENEFSCVELNIERFSE